jgi:hypothetical protein
MKCAVIFNEYIRSREMGLIYIATAKPRGHGWKVRTGEMSYTVLETPCGVVYGNV